MPASRSPPPPVASVLYEAIFERTTDGILLTQPDGSLESERGLGTRVTVTLPLAPALP